jgi:hypothetical protein
MHLAARRLLLAAALLAVALGACGDDDDAAPETTTSAAPTTTDESTTTTAPPACAPASVPDDAVEVSEADGDVDGDGSGDVLRTYLSGADWHLQVELAADGGADLVVPSFGGLVGIIGGADVDGDGTDEVWLRTGSGASATIVGLARLVDCDLVRVTFAGDQLAELPVGGSVGTTSGLECSGSTITAYTASLREGTTYDVTGTEYTLDGSVLTESGTSTATVDALDDAAFVPVSTFSCGDLVL